MSEFVAAWLKTGREEGGYSDNLKDSGGPTNWGITERVARAHGFVGHMRDLSHDRARQIAKEQYWDIMRLDEVAILSTRIAHELFDTGLNAGQATVVKFLQRCLNVGNRGSSIYADMTVDGLMGRVSVAALRDFLKHRGPQAEVALLNAMNGLQSAHYTELAERREKDEEFWLGWQFNRVKFE